MTPIASLVIPAHNEERSLPRLLGRLQQDVASGELEVIVVCNGCTDRTSSVARAFPGVRVLETPQPSKQRALKLGDQNATIFPRVYIDADVDIDGSSVRQLVSAVGVQGVLAAGPARLVSREGIGVICRWYYDVWESLPAVDNQLFGRGVIALSKPGYERIRSLPEVASDDLAIAQAFMANEFKVLPGAIVRIRPPATVRDLMRRRIRVAAGVRELGQARGSAASTSAQQLLSLALARPATAFKVPVFLAVAVAARLGAGWRRARGDNSWLRDESSRASLG